MKRKLEKELINYFLSSGKYRVHELTQDSGGETIWMVQGSINGEVDEMAVFTDSSNYMYAKERFERYIDEAYIGNKGVSATFLIQSKDEDDVINKQQTTIDSKFIVSTSIVQIDTNTFEVLYNEGFSNIQQGIFLFLQYKEKQKKSMKSSKLTLTNILIAVNVIMFLITAAASKNILDIDAMVLLKFGAKYSPLIDLGEYHRLITSAFLHGGLLHLVLNMYGLKMIGSLIEKIYGSMRYALIYFASAITGSIFSYILSDSLSVGASGAIFGLLGTAAVYGIKMKNRINRDFLNNIFQVIFTNLVIGFTISNIDNAAHIGGLVGGVLITGAIELSRQSK